MSRNNLALVTLFLLAAPASAAAPEGAAGEDRITRRMQSFVDAGEIAGAVTLVARRGEIVHLAAVGHADIEHDLPMHKDSIFAIASMTKPFTATAVMILQDEGRLSVDDPVSKYLPRFRETHLVSGPAKRELTIRHLMTHTSGIARLPRRNTAPLTRNWELEDSVDLLGRLPLQFEPGRQWKYSVGLNVCARIVEVVSKQPFDEFLDKRILQPLAMKDTTFFPDAKQRARLARTYKLAPNGQSLVHDLHWMHDFSQPRTPNPSGGLFSTAGDLLRFYQAILNGGQLEHTRIVSERAVRTMTRLQTEDLPTGFTEGNGWGLGWCVVRKPQGATAALSPASFGHGGVLGTQAWIDPQREMICILLIQRTDLANSDGSRFRKAFQELAIQAGSR